jgi:hypothetical protein
VSAEEILITHDGYTDTSYATCGDSGCTLTALRAIGVPERAAVHYLDVKIALDPTTTVEVALLGESDSCEWCATCGEFIRHGIVYPGEDVGCHHANDAGEMDDVDPPALPGPHIDLQNTPAMREYWGRIVNLN